MDIDTIVFAIVYGGTALMIGPIFLRLLHLYTAL